MSISCKAHKARTRNQLPHTDPINYMPGILIKTGTFTIPSIPVIAIPRISTDNYAHKYHVIFHKHKLDTNLTNTNPTEHTFAGPLSSRLPSPAAKSPAQASVSLYAAAQ